MKYEDFNDWLYQMKFYGRAKTEGDCAFLIGVSLDTMTRMKKRGCDHKTALACSALLVVLEPYRAETKGI